jgi:PAS domain S-box-containing protein
MADLDREMLVDAEPAEQAEPLALEVAAEPAVDVDGEGPAADAGQDGAVVELASRRRPQPTSGERAFALEELFFSVTNAKGHITFGNSVFARIADYELEEMVGRNHNIVRHPDMPRAVFKLLWDRLAEGKPTAAYVKNLAKDGRYYWVLALVYPAGGEYLSIRVKPASEYFPVVAKLYEQLRKIELDIEGEAGRNRKAAMEASGAELGRALQGLGFADYDSFMCQMFLSEMLARNAATTGPGPTVVEASTLETRLLARSCASLAEIGRAGHSLSAFLAELLGNADRYSRLSQDLHGKLASLMSLADAIDLFSLNAIIASTRLGADGVTLGVVSRHMREQAFSTVRMISEIKSQIEETLALLEPLNFSIASSRLQAEMVAAFVGELLLAAEHEDEDEDEDAPAERETDSRASESFAKFIHGLSEGTNELERLLGEAKTHFRELASTVTRLARELAVIKALEINGRIESSRDAGLEAVRLLFNEISGHVLDAEQTVAQLDTIRDVRDQTEQIDFRHSHQLLQKMSAATDTLALQHAA